MKRFRIFAVAFLSAVLLFAGQVPARADITGAGDAALLLQQVLQYIQDFDIDEAKWADINSKIQRAREITDRVMKGKNGYDALNSVMQASAQVVRTCNTMDKYMDYVGEYGSAFQWNCCGIIYRQYESRTAELIDSMSKTLTLLADSDSENAHQLMSTLNDAAQSFSNSLEKFDREAVGEMRKLCRKASRDENVRRNSEFYSLSVS